MVHCPLLDENQNVVEGIKSNVIFQSIGKLGGAPGAPKQTIPPVESKKLTVKPITNYFTNDFIECTKR